MFHACFERADDVVTLEGRHRPVEQTLLIFLVVELGYLKIERQVVVRDPLAVAGGNDTLDEIFQLANVAGPPVMAKHAQGRLGDAFDAFVEA